MQLIAEKEILIVVSLVHCCAIKKNVIVASQLYDVADVQFTAEKEGSYHYRRKRQKEQVMTPQDRRPTGICPGAPSLQPLHL